MGKNLVSLDVVVLLGNEISRPTTEWEQYEWKARENSYKRNKIKITKHVDCSWYFHGQVSCMYSVYHRGSLRHLAFLKHQPMVMSLFYVWVF